MKIEPAGHRVIVKPDPLNEIQEKEMQQFERLKASGFEVAEVGDKKRMQGAVHTGVLVEVGPQAWIAHALSIINNKVELMAAGWSWEAVENACRPWARVGQRVYFAKYGGHLIDVDGVQCRLLNDEDVTAVIREEAA